MKRELSKSDQVQRNFGITYVACMSLIWALTIIMSFSERWDTADFVLMNIQFWFNITFLAIAIFVDVASIRRLLAMYIIVIAVISFPILIQNCILQRNEAILWALLNMLGISVFYYANNKSFYWNIFICLQVIAALIIAEIWGESALDIFGKDSKLYIIFGNNYVLNAVFMLSMAMMMFYFRYLTYEARYEESLENDYQEKELLRNDKNYFKLYEQILRYFDEKKPYLDTQFSVNACAVALNTNAVYISQAIKTNKKINFSEFTNTYRVKRAIDMMQEDKDKKYTLQYIYQVSGFQSQSTFNRVFKQVTGFTPSDYLEKGVI